MSHHRPILMVQESIPYEFGAQFIYSFFLLLPPSLLLSLSKMGIWISTCQNVWLEQGRWLETALTVEDVAFGLWLCFFCIFAGMSRLLSAWEFHSGKLRSASLFYLRLNLDSAESLEYSHSFKVMLTLSVLTLLGGICMTEKCGCRLIWRT